MKEIVEWLIHIEEASCKVYRDAAAYFNDPELVAFLEHCAEDEEHHAEIMSTAAHILQNRTDIKSTIVVDQQIKDAIELPFREIQKQLRANTLTQAQLIDCIIATEYSEWNDIFLYVVNVMMKKKTGFKSAAAQLQDHLNHVERFLTVKAYGLEKIEKLKALKPVWTERILIIEDDPQLAELFSSVLHMEGLVEVASDGETGLGNIRQNYYRLIVSDVNMPGLDGISVYRRAAAEFPNIGERYLFLTGNPDPDLQTYFLSNNLKFLTKPASIHDIQSHVLEILNKTYLD